MIKGLQNIGITILNKQSIETEEKTVIVVGVERSGTSMVGMVLSQLGIFLGETHDKAVFEDINIFTSLESENYDKFEGLVSKYNRDYTIWGWKRPQAFRYAERYVKRVRNPHFIVLFRDSFSIAVRNSISVNTEIKGNLLATAKKNLDLAEFVQNCEYPILCLSYEKSMTNKSVFINTLIDYLGVSISDEVKAKALSSMVNGQKEYLLKSRVQPKPKSKFGRIDKINSKFMAGWAYIPNIIAPLEITIMDGNKEIGKTVAKIFRKDLLEHKFGDGHHAFKFEFPQAMKNFSKVYFIINENNEKVF